MSANVRRPDFAGTWYPREAEECLRLFQSFDQDCVAAPAGMTLVGGIVPHAGWIFSGRIAYNVIRELARGRPETETVVLFGRHLQPSSPATVMVSGSFWTPLGEIPTDEELAAQLADSLTLVREDPKHHTPDNTLELQAPFIRHLLPNARLVAIAAPPCGQTLVLADAVASISRELQRRIVLLGSTDLTHYGPSYGWSPKGRGPAAQTWVREVNDRRFIEVTCSMDPEAMIREALESSNACCPGAAAAAVRTGLKLGAAKGSLLTYATSADVRPDDSFVGYAGVVF